MHEIVVMDDEEYEDPASRSVSKDFSRGIEAIMEFLEMNEAFKIVRENSSKYRLVRIQGTPLPKWISDTGGGTKKAPEGIYECPHCGKWFNNDVEYSMHTKLHYII